MNGEGASWADVLLGIAALTAFAVALASLLYRVSKPFDAAISQDENDRSRG